MKIRITSEAELSSLAKKILIHYPHKRIFGFYGEMGAGKTTLIKEMCNVLGVENITSSPTFAIVNEYSSSCNEPVYHFDFYRIESEKEALQIGFYDYLNSHFYCFIEWTEKIESLLGEDFVKVQIEVVDNGDRIVSF